MAQLWNYPGKMAKPQESLKKRLLGTTKKKLTWAAGTVVIIVVGGIVICLFKFGSGTQEKVGPRTDGKSGNGHAAESVDDYTAESVSDGQLQSRTRKLSPILNSSTSSSESTTEQVGETHNSTTVLGEKGKTNNGVEVTKAKSIRMSKTQIDSIRSQPDMPEKGIHFTEIEIPANPFEPKKVTANQPEENGDSTETEKPANPLKPKIVTAAHFKTSKDNFLTKARNAFLDPAVNVDQLKSQFGLVVQTLDDVKKASDANYEDPEDPKIVADSKFDGYMGSYFVKIVDELIPQFDTKFTEICVAGDAKALETLFNHWLSWMAVSKVNLTGKATPEWIRFKSFSEAKKWFSGTNPNIIPPSERLHDLLNSLKDEGIITVEVPNSVFEQTPEIFAKIVIELNEKGQNDKAKKVMEEFTNANADDSKNVEMVTKIISTQSAVKDTLKFINSDGAIKSLFNDKYSKALKQIEEAKNVDQLLDAINSTFVIGSGMKTPSSVLVKAFSSYLRAKGESETVLSALQAIQDSLGVDKAENLGAEEKLQQANAWTEVIVNIRNESDLKMLVESVANSKIGYYCFSLSSGYPESLLSNSQRQPLVEILRVSAKEQTNSIAKAKNMKEYLQILSQIDLSHCPCSLKEYLKALSCSHDIFSDISGAFYNLAYLDKYDNSSSDKTGLLKEVLGKRLKRVPTMSKDNDAWYMFPRGLRKLADHFEKVGDKKEAEEWRAFALEADVIFSLGLPNETKYERIFNEYKGLKRAGVTEAGLSNFLNLLSTLEPEYNNRAKFLLSRLVSGVSLNNMQNVYESIAAVDSKQVAQNLIKCRGVVVDYLNLSDGNHLNFEIPFLIGVLDDEVVQFICKKNQHPFSIPSNLGFKESVEFKNFVKKQTVFFGRLLDYNAKHQALKKMVKERLSKLAPLPDFAPNIGFMDWRILQNSQPYGAELIDAYEALANVIDAYADPGLARKMKEHAAQVKEDCKKLS